MQNSIFTAIIALAEEYQGRELLEQVNSVVPEVFTLLEEPETEINTHDYKAVIEYVAYMYSVDSPVQVLGTDHTERKRIVQRNVGLGVNHIQKLVVLNNPNCKKIVLAYLDKQIDRDWRHLMRTKELYESIADLQYADMEGEDGKIDVKTVVDASKQLSNWAKEIETLENKLRAKYKAILPSFDEVMPAKGSSEESHRIERSKWIK